MSITVNLSKNLVNDAKFHCITEYRSVSEQIEYWARIGLIIMKHDGLTYSHIQGIINGQY